MRNVRGPDANGTENRCVTGYVRSTWNGGTALSADCDQLALAVHRLEDGAFERLVERFESSLTNYVTRLLQSAPDAQEVVQDAFVRAHNALTNQYEQSRVRELALKPWLFKIARNLSLNRRRGIRNELERPLEDFDDGRIGPMVPGMTVTGTIEAREEREALQRAIDSLPEEARELIVLRFMEEMSYGEIAKCTGQSEAALRGRVFRSLKLLRAALSEGVAESWSA